MGRDKKKKVKGAVAVALPSPKELFGSFSQPNVTIA
jgi:hypothetical protein